MVRPNPGALWPTRELARRLVLLEELPVTVIHGQDDWLVHHRHGEALFDALVGPKRWLLIEDRRGFHAEMLAHFYREVLEEAILNPPVPG